MKFPVVNTEGYTTFYDTVRRKGKTSYNHKHTLNNGWYEHLDTNKPVSLFQISGERSGAQQILRLCLRDEVKYIL